MVLAVAGQFIHLSRQLDNLGQRCAARQIQEQRPVDRSFGRATSQARFERPIRCPGCDRHISRQEYRLQDMARRSAKLGKKLNLKPAFWPTNPAPSSYAIIAAQSAGGGDLASLVHGLTRACWAEEKDISQDDVIVACLASSACSCFLTERKMVGVKQAQGLF